MARLIDADALKAHYAWWSGGTAELTLDEAKRDFDTIIDLQPTVEAEPTKHQDTESWRTTATEGVGEYAPIKHGTWEWTKFYGSSFPTPCRCSRCGFNLSEIVGQQYIGKPLNYCPFCGARMTVELGGGENG